jgi:hypothetical protein
VLKEAASGFMQGVSAMSRDLESGLHDQQEWYLTGPYRLVYVSLGLSVAAVVAGAVSGSGATFFSVLFMLAALLTSGGAVWWRLTGTHPDDFEERSKTGIIVALSSGAALAAHVVTRQHDWDSLGTFTIVLWLFTLCSVLVLLLPQLGRRIVLSLAVLFHFGAILTAVTAVPSHRGYPWVPFWVWNNVYKNYVTFTYLNNAYHFYSPEPGPPTLVWFQVEFEPKPGEYRTHWLRIVRREDYATRQQYQRMLSMTESTNAIQVSQFSKIQRLGIRREAAATGGYKIRGKPTQIPMAPQTSWEAQYREPMEHARQNLESYALYVLRTTRHPDFPDLKPTGVKIYRITHQLIFPDRMELGLSPTDPTFYEVFFQGRYRLNADGTKAELYYEPSGKKDETTVEWVEQDAAGRLRKVVEPARDPTMYWMLPIYRMPKEGHENSKRLKDYILIDAFSAHAGEKIPWDDLR